MDNIEHRLEAARGWLDLGLPAEAAEELNGLDEPQRLDPEALVLYVSVYRQQEDWRRLMNVSRLLYDSHPERVEGHLGLALATRRRRGPLYALGLLMEATKLFPNEAAVYYDLACCECLNGNLILARGWLNEAFKLAPGLRAAARVDPDLAGVLERA